jgi:YVTN family beta-propeller protein
MSPRATSVLLMLCVAFPAAARAGSSNSLLDVAPDGSLLLVANADNASVTVVDTASNKALREIKVGREPQGVTWIGNGPLAAATSYRDNLVVLFDAKSGHAVARIPVRRPHPRRRRALWHRR